MQFEYSISGQVFSAALHSVHLSTFSLSAGTLSEELPQLKTEPI